MTRDFSSRAQGRSRWGLGERAVVAMAALLLTLVCGWASVAWSGHRYASARVQAAREELARARAAPRRGPDDALAGRAALTQGAPPGSVLGALASLLPPDVRIEGLTLKYGERLELDLRVAARNSKAYDIFLARLEGSALFEQVEPGEENREGEVRTSVRAKYRGGAS